MLELFLLQTEVFMVPVLPSRMEHQYGETYKQHSIRSDIMITMILTRSMAISQRTDVKHTLHFTISKIKEATQVMTKQN